MASIWTQGTGNSPLIKLEGHLPARPSLVRQRLVDWAQRLAKKNHAKIIKGEEFEIFLEWPDGRMFSVFVEFLSPPSAEEPHQPKRKVSQ